METITSYTREQSTTQRILFQDNGLEIFIRNEWNCSGLSDSTRYKLYIKQSNRKGTFTLSLYMNCSFFVGTTSVQNWEYKRAKMSRKSPRNQLLILFQYIARILPFQPPYQTTSSSPSLRYLSQIPLNPSQTKQSQWKKMCTLWLRSKETPANQPTTSGPHSHNRVCSPTSSICVVHNTFYTPASRTIKRLLHRRRRRRQRTETN